MNNKYILLHPTQPQSGLFAFLWQTLRGIYHNPYQQYYFHFGPECCYYDHSIVGVNNAWDYYFAQPHSDRFPEHVYKEVGLIFDQESEFREGEEFDLGNDEYNRRRYIFNKIITNYFVPHPHIISKINNFWNEKLAGNNVLGIHCRGTDHPNNVNLSHYLDQIEAVSTSYDKIFAMSDEQGKIDVLQQRFGDKLVTYDTFRSTSNAPVHISLRHLHNPRLIGEEALIETYLMARTQHLLFYTVSNVNFFIRALAPDLPYTLLK